MQLEGYVARVNEFQGEHAAKSGLDDDRRRNEKSKAAPRRATQYLATDIHGKVYIF
jgi:hypothetical protein